MLIQLKYYEEQKDNIQKKYLKSTNYIYFLAIYTFIFRKKNDNTFQIKQITMTICEQ